MPPPDRFIQHLQDLGYHPRSNKHSNALAIAIVHDLVTNCPALAREARAGTVVYDLNMDLRVRTAYWNVDLVLGSPSTPAKAVDRPVARATPSTVRIAIEIKSVMTEHRKAVKNRKRDFEAHHDHVHNYNRRALAGGVMVINAARRFLSPLRREPTIHGTKAGVARLVEHCLNEMRNVAESGRRSPYGMDGKTALVIEFDNMAKETARYVIGPPAPQQGDPLHYDSFLQRLCDEYTARFARTR